MYEAERAEIETLRLQFERQIAAVNREVRAITAEYMAALSVLADSVSSDPAVESRPLSPDPTGTRNRIQRTVRVFSIVSERDGIPAESTPS
jgi:hypothetical protein